MSKKKGRYVHMTGAELADAAENMPVRHEPFDEERREKIRVIAQIFAEVRPMSVTEWEFGFRRDTNPDKEIDLWLTMGRHYRVFTSALNSAAAKTEIFHILNCASMTKRDVVQKEFPKVLTHAEFRVVVQTLWPDGGQYAAFHRMIELQQGMQGVIDVGVPGADPVPISEDGAKRFQQIQPHLMGASSSDVLTMAYSMVIGCLFSSMKGLKDGFGSPAVQEAYEIYDRVFHGSIDPSVEAAVIVESLRRFVHAGQRAQDRKAGGN